MKYKCWQKIYISQINFAISQNGPLKYTSHAGEIEVLKLLFQKAIPTLLGWDTLLTMQANLNTNKPVPQEGNYGNNVFSAGDENTNNIPF